MRMLMKRTLALLLMLIMALQSLIAAADMHHGAESLAGPPLHHHHQGAVDHEGQMHKHSSGQFDDSRRPSCHTHICICLTLHLVGHGGRLFFGLGDQAWFPAEPVRFSSWISKPAFRPPIV